MGGNATSRLAANSWMWALSLSPSHCPSYGLGDGLVRDLQSLSDSSVVQAQLMQVQRLMGDSLILGRLSSIG